MASSTVVKRADLYPAATVVRLFRLDNPNRAELSKQAGNPEGWQSALPKVGEATVAANGELTFTNLEPAVQYLAWASVAGSDAYLRVQVPTDAAGQPREPFAENANATGAAVALTRAAVAGKRYVVTEISASIVATGAVAASKAIEVFVEQGARKVFLGLLAQSKTTGAGEGAASASWPCHIAFGVGEELKVSSTTPDANAHLSVNASGYVE